MAKQELTIIPQSVTEKPELDQQLTDLVNQFHNRIDKKEFLAFIKSCYKQNDEKGYISCTITFLEEEGKTEFARVYKNLDDLKKVDSEIIKQVVSVAETYERDSEFVLLTKLYYGENPLGVYVSKFKGTD